MTNANNSLSFFTGSKKKNKVETGYTLLIKFPLWKFITNLVHILITCTERTALASGFLTTRLCQAPFFNSSPHSFKGNSHSFVIYSESALIANSSISKLVSLPLFFCFPFFLLKWADNFELCAFFLFINLLSGTCYLILGTR